MISKLLHSWNSLPISQTRNRRLPVMLSQHIPTGSTVLDVGSGNGEMAWTLSNIGVVKSIVGVDVVLQPDPKISVSLFDGVSLPFADKEFDVVTLIDVLHHCEAQAALVADTLRVARSHVVIKDHYWNTEFDRLILKVSDYIGNQPYGVSLPYTYLRMEEWEALFQKVGARAVVQEQFQYARHDRCKQVIFKVVTDQAQQSKDDELGALV